MKKTILILILFVLTLTTYSQKQLVGMNGGVIFSNINTNSDFFPEKTFKTDWTSNINYERYFTEKISIETGIQYERKGFIDYFTYLDENGNEIKKEQIISQYEYISIPIGVKYSIGNKFKTFGEIGMTPSYFVNGKIIYPDDIIIISPIPPLKDIVNRFDLGAFVCFGLSYQIFNKMELNVNGIFNHSFISMTSVKYFEKYKIYNYLYSVNIGLKYFLKDE
jgi:hypothetical protein